MTFRAGDASPPRLLVVLPQLPQDPAGGAARSVNTIAGFLAAAGWSVRVLATLASEARRTQGDDGAPSFHPVSHLRGLGLEPRREGKDGGRAGVVWLFKHRGVAYTLLDTGARPPYDWQDALGAAFDRRFDAAIADFQPHLLFTFGGQPGDVRRHARARARGCKLVFALRNNSYHEPGFFDHMDAVLTSSEAHAESYRRSIGLESTPLPTPLDLDDVLVPAREPIFFTAVNPSPEKGLFFLARLAEELGTRRPDLPLLVVEGRGAGGLLVEAGMAGGFDLRRHENVMFSPPVARPRDFLAGARALLAPSVWAEPSGRVVAEALVNGVPPLVSGRGGLEEVCHGGGFVLPLPAELTVDTRQPVGAAAVAPWLRVIEELADDAEAYTRASRRAEEAGRRYLPETLAPRYVDFFRKVLMG